MQILSIHVIYADLLQITWYIVLLQMLKENFPMGFKEETSQWDSITVHENNTNGKYQRL